MKEDSIKNLAQSFLAILILVVFVYYTSEYFEYPIAYLWKTIKIIQLFSLSVIEIIIITPVNFMAELITGKKLLSGWGFLDALNIIHSTDPTLINESFRDTIDSYFGDILKWPFAILIFYVGYKERAIRSVTTKTYKLEELIRSASKVYPHLRRITPPSVADKILAYTIGCFFKSYRERLNGVNPMDYSHDYDFNNRDEKHNMFAMGVSPTEMLTVCPPLGVTRNEIERDIEMQNNTGFESQFRPICYFFYEDDSTQSTMDFCSRTATISFERLMVKPAEQELTDLRDVARIFDKNGNVVPLEFINNNSQSVKKFTKGCRVVGGFRTSRLLNNGKPYKGKIDNVLFLFNHFEKRILKQLKDKIDHTTERTFEEIVYAIVTKRHAYSTTVIWALVDLFDSRSRIGGNEFSWVSEFDRTLSMVMQSIGRETPFWEAAGTRSHYLIETRNGFPVTVPVVTKAVEDLYVNAERILSAGEKPENIFTMSADAYDSVYNTHDILETQIIDQTNAALQDLGIDKDNIEYVDPFSDVTELMKLYEEVN